MIEVWMVQSKSKTSGRYYGLACDFAFASKAAAEYWIEKQSGSKDTTEYWPHRMPIFDLDYAKELWP